MTYANRSYFRNLLSPSKHNTVFTPTDNRLFETTLNIFKAMLKKSLRNLNPIQDTYCLAKTYQHVYHDYKKGLMHAQYDINNNLYKCDIVLKKHPIFKEIPQDIKLIISDYLGKNIYPLNKIALQTLNNSSDIKKIEHFIDQEKQKNDIFPISTFL